MQKLKRIPKSKEELKAQMEHLQKIEYQKKLARKVFPIIENLKTIYDAQTVVNALAGFIKAEIARKMTELKVEDLVIDLSKEKKSEVVDSILALHAIFLKENADDLVALLERFGNGLGQFSSKEYMKNPMKKIKMQDFIA